MLEHFRDLRDVTDLTNREKRQEAAKMIEASGLLECTYVFAHEIVDLEYTYASSDREKGVAQQVD